MSSPAKWDVAIVNYGMGNLLSVQHACEAVGLRAGTTSSTDDLERSAAIILPGVGAFGEAMANLRRLDLIDPLRALAASDKPFLAICLGMQLLMSESAEFGRHEGLGIIEGAVKPLATSVVGTRTCKVPHIGWNQIHRPSCRSWADTWLHGSPDGTFMYFLHSFHARPADADLVLSTTRYGELEFCSSFSIRNLFACQFHPERSGSWGLQIYRRLACLIRHTPWREPIHAG